MSSLWTPGGEVPVDRTPQPEPSGPPPGAADMLGVEDIDEEQAKEIAAEMAQVREQLAAAPAEDVVSNHVMGLYELAAIHLSNEPPNLDAARLAIDACGALVEGLKGRLGQHEPVLNDALNQLRMAFVQLKTQAGSDAPADT